MPATFLSIHPKNPEPRKIQEVVKCLQEGGIVVYPTDTIYGMGCDIHNPRAVERLCKIKKVEPRKNNFSIICADLSHISEYANISDNTFKIMKKALPGAYTFVLKASSKLPKILHTNKKTIGIRIPDHNIPLEIVRQLENPIITTSIKNLDDIVEYPTYPEDIYKMLKHEVDIVIDGGAGQHTPSTILDCTEDEPTLIRLGLGDVSWLGLE
ncbi:MAG: L-threonylcarbamoyladenylate synthase [Microscillaceae bacterium]|nr:L-threonylcarbamoyladenylate synthase [Microscillaceae bacterium]MDW8460341.1 L-threonylcarbamoyladenylate synthase [Cytophagales bacterium]